MTPDLTAFFPNTNVTIELWFQANGPGVLVDELGSYPNVNWHDSQIEVVTTATNNAYANVLVSVWPLPSPWLTVGQVLYGTWNHVALTYNQTNTTLVGFLNGVPTSSTSVSRQAPQKYGYGLFYGVGMGDTTTLGSGAYFNGQIDEFRLWNVARNTNDIQANLNRPLAGNEPGLVAYWQFDECSGTVASDTTGHGNDGTLYGPTWTNSTVHYGPWITTLPATNLTTTSATLQGTVNPQGFGTTAWFQWGTTTNYANTTSVTNAGSGINPVALSTGITSLAAPAIYHFRAVATNSYGVSYGADQSLWLGPPLVTTLPATDLTTNAATVNGSVIPSGPSAQAWFQWGLTTNYSSATVPVALVSGTIPVAVTNRLQPLLSGYTYHYRIVATNSFGMTLGSDLSFTGPVFGEIGAGLPGVFGSSVAWGDYNNDGYLDILLTGRTTGGSDISKIYRNNGNGALTDSGLSLPGIEAGSVAWGDYDNDGYLDVLLTGTTNGNFSSAGISNFYRNNGNGSFTDLFACLPGVGLGSVAWGDYNNDGYPDILLTGYTGSGYISKVYRNNGNGTFTDLNAGLPGVYQGSVAWGDYDNDGYLDFLLTGTTSGDQSGAISKTYRNNRNGTFTEVTTTSLSGAFYGSVAWGDYDNDGRLDLLLTGMDPAGSYVSHLYHNYWPVTNNAPVAPGNLTANVVGTNAILSWSVGSDPQTPAPGLSYNLRVGTTPGGSNVVSPQAAASGFRRVPQLGNMQQNLSASLTGLKYGSNYYWSVQAVDTAFAGSPFVSQGSFAVTLAPSAVSASVGSIMGSSAVLDASVYPNGSATTAYFQWGATVSYGNSTGVQNLGSGTGLVSLRQTFTGLQPGTLYHYRIVTSNANGTTYGPDQTFYLDPAVIVGDVNGNGLVDRGELDAVLSSYWPTSPWLYLTNTAGLGGTNVTFALTNSTAGAFSVLVSTNLVDWGYLGPATPRYEFTDTNAPAMPQRFYRLSWP